MLTMQLKNLLFKGLILLALCVSGTDVFAKDGYHITVNARNCDDSTAYLCYYYGKQSAVYRADSAKFAPGSNVKFAFSSNKAVAGGIYLILFSDRATRCEMLLNNGDEFEVSFDKKNVISTTSYKGSSENTNFLAYQDFVKGIGEQYELLKTQLSTAKNKADSTSIESKFKPLSSRVEEYRNKLIKDNKGTLAAAIFSAMMEPKVPEGKHYIGTTKVIDSTFSGRYYKTHYWDNFDFQDNRLVHSPIYDNKLESYFKLVVPTPDSLNKECDSILAKARGAKDVFKYSLWWMSRFTENSKVMGVDESFVYLVETYYMKGDAFWMHDTMVKKYIDQAAKIAPNMINQKAADIRLPDIDGTVAPLSEIYPKHDYTLVVFWSGDCGHCKKEVPAMDSAIAALKAIADIAIYGVHTDSDDGKWRKFLNEHQLKSNWTHLHDPMRVGNWRKSYNVYTTPVIYLIDRAGVIKGKRLDHSNVGGLVKFLQKKTDKK
jgi:peroxiredoxin